MIQIRDFIFSRIQLRQCFCMHMSACLICIRDRKEGYNSFQFWGLCMWEELNSCSNSCLNESVLCVSEREGGKREWKSLCYCWPSVPNLSYDCGCAYCSVNYPRGEVWVIQAVRPAEFSLRTYRLLFLNSLVFSFMKTVLLRDCFAFCFCHYRAIKMWKQNKKVFFTPFKRLR